MKLKKSGIVLNENTHTYSDKTGKTFQGVTKMLSHYIGKDKYENVDAEVLKRACDYGHKVHKALQMYIEFGIFDNSEEVRNFADWYDDSDIANSATEYIVTDGEFFASPIDFVAERADGRVVLFDFKTSSVLDVEQTAWQLSIYAKWFEEMNGIVVDEICAIHLRGDQFKRVSLKRIGNDEIERMLNAWKNGEEWSQSSLQLNESAEVVKQLQLNIEEIEMQLKMANERMANFKSQMYDLMEANNIKKYESDGLVITRVLPSVRKTKKLDEVKFVQDFGEDVLKQYQTITETEIKGSIRIKLK